VCFIHFLNFYEHANNKLTFSGTPYGHLSCAGSGKSEGMVFSRILTSRFMSAFVNVDINGPGSFNLYNVRDIVFDHCRIEGGKKFVLYNAKGVVSKN
jgi:hypothetical protein